MIASKVFLAEAKCGVRVCNVSLPVLRERGQEHPFAVFEF
jgi:hypothetical protein